MAYFDELLQRAITVRNNRAPASNTADLVGGVLVGIVTALQMLLDDKQDELTFDTAPTADSQNPVTSDGIYQALQAIDLSACEKIVNKVTSINAQSTNVQYPTAKLLYDSLQALSGIYAAIQHTHAIADIINLQNELNARQLVSNLVTAITAQSTDQQYPSAKLLYDQLALKANQATTYTKTEVDTLIGALSTISFAVVQQLPTSDIQTNVIYLVPAAQPGQSNIYNEYIYVNNSWELIGSTAIDLSGYEQTVNKVTALTAQSTNVQYPSAKCVYDELQLLYDLIYSYHPPFVIRGTSSNIGGSETFTIRYIDNGVVQPQTTVTVPVDSEGNWSFMYKLRVYSLQSFALNKTTILSVDFSDADDFGQCVNANWAFDSCTNLVSVNLSNATFINLIEAGDMFDNCAALTTIIWSEQLDLSNLQRQNLYGTYAGQDGMFARCPNLTQLDFSGQTFGALLTTLGMFKGCTNLATLNLSNATFASATNASTMFLGCAALTSIDLHSATFAAVTSTQRIFAGCGAVNIDLSAATFANLEDGIGMFLSCAALEGVTFGANLNLDKLKYLSTSNNNYGMFEGCTHLKTFSMPTQTFPLLERCYRMFYNCQALTSVDLSAAVMGNVTLCHQMFQGCTNLATLNLSNATFASATNASTMFLGCAALTSIDLHSATFAAVTSTQRIFAGCGAVNIDLSAATFANLEDGIGMFLSCAALEGVTFGANLNLDKLKYLSTSNNYYGMFEGCTHLKTFSMPTQTFPLLERCYHMFYNCQALTSVDLSAATMANVTIWHQMYYNCKVLTDISVPQNSTAPATSSTANNGAVNLAQSPLNYTSMLKIANWLRDFTGYTAHTCTFKTSVWNALTAAEQSNIDTILSGKNWTRVLAA